MPTPTNVNTVASSGAAQTLTDPSAGIVLSAITLTANCALAFPRAALGKQFEVLLTQDATGSRTVTWPSAAKWPAGTAPTLTTTAARRDAFRFRCYDGSNWVGEIVGQDYV